MCVPLERTLFTCPIISTDIENEIYPSPSDENVILMSLKWDPKSDHRHVFGFLRTNMRGENYIEIDFYHERFYSKSYKRFIIQRGYMLSESDEAIFLNHCENPNIEIDIEDFVMLQEAFAQYCPDIPIRPYETSEIGEYLKRIYFSTHCCGAIEILYKAGLEHVASYINEVEDYNIIGTTPAKILSMPLNLIRILDKNGQDEYIKSIELREVACKTYELFSDYCGKNHYPNRYQWLYLIECTSIGGLNNYTFNKKLYRKLAHCKNSFEYRRYKRFMELATQLGQYNLYKKLPKSENIIDMTDKMEILAKILSQKDEKNAGIVRFNNCGYQYEDNEYFVKTPLSVFEIFDESCQQDNCLSSYIDDLATGKTNIVFVRKKCDPDKSYITMEIKEHDILQARAKGNEIPDRRGFEFIEQFARHNWLSFDPVYLILCDDDYDNGNVCKELVDYLAEFREKSSRPYFPDDGITWTQLCLWDCFPECFTTDKSL